MLTLLMVAILGGAGDFDLLGEVRAIKSDVAALKAEIAALKAKCKCGEAVTTAGPVNVGGNAVTIRLVDDGRFNLLRAAGTVATAPVRAVGQICSGGQCRPAVESEAATFEPMPAMNGSCANGQCMPQRRGLFGRRGR